MNDDNEKDPKEPLRIDCPGDQTQDPTEVHGVREDPYRAGWPSRGSQYIRSMPQGGDSPHPVLQMEQSVPGGREISAQRGYDSGSRI